MALKKIKVGNTVYDIGGTDEGKVNLTTPFTSNGEIVIAEDTTGVKGSGVQVSDLVTKEELNQLDLGAPITPVEILPEATEETLNQHKIYNYNNALHYIAQMTSDEPIIGEANPLIASRYSPSFTTAMVNNQLYIFFGVLQNEYSSAIYKYDVDTKTVSKLTSTTSYSQTEKRATVSGQYIYIIGGHSQSYDYQYDNIFKLDTTTDSVTTLVNINDGTSYGRCGASAATVGNKVYFLGGSRYTGSGSGQNYTTSVISIDTTTDQISYLNNILPTGTKNAATAAVGTDIWLFGGANNSQSIMRFDTVTNTAETINTTLPSALTNGDAIAIGNEVYIIAGNQIWKFNTDAQSLTVLDVVLPNSYSNIRTEFYDNKIYVCGAMYSDYIYCLDLSLNDYYVLNTLTDTTALNSRLESQYEAVTNLVNSSLDSKQDKLTAGTGISISGSTISSYNTLVAGNGISIDGNVINCTSSGIEIVDITDLDTIPEEYQDIEKLKTCYLKDNESVFHLTFIDGTDLYYGCLDDLIYTSIYVNSSFAINRREDYQKIDVASQTYVNQSINALKNTTNQSINTLAREVSTKQNQLTAGRNIVIEENGTIGIANPNNCKVVTELPELTPELANEETIYSYEGKLYNILYDTTMVEHDDLRLINSYQALPYKLNGMSAVAVGDNIYILGGYSPDVGTSSKPIYQFNTITKSITEVPGSPWIYTEDNPLLVVGRTLYWRAYNISRTDGMYSFNLDTNEYQYYEFDDIYLTYHGGINTATVLGTDIYYITIDGEVQKFDTVNHTFSQYDQLDTDVDMGGCAVITYGNDIYIFGSIESDAIIKYTPATKTKRTLSATIPGGYYADAAITIWKDKILLIGGHDDGYENDEKFFFDNIYCFDPQTETLTELDIKLGHKYSKDLMAVTVNNTIYIIGGCNYDTSTNLILEYSNCTTEPTNMRYQQLTYGDASFNPYFKDTGLVLDELADEEMSGGMWVYTPVRGE